MNLESSEASEAIKFNNQSKQQSSTPPFCPVPSYSAVVLALPTVCPAQPWKLPYTRT